MCPQVIIYEVQVGIHAQECTRSTPIFQVRDREIVKAEQERPPLVGIVAVYGATIISDNIAMKCVQT